MKERSIQQKITSRILLIGGITFLLSLALSCILFLRPLKQDAVSTAEQINQEAVQQMDTLLDFVGDYTENLDLSVAQNSAIMQYFTAPNLQAQNIASLHLNNLISYEGLIRSVIVETDSGPILNSLNKLTDADFALLETDWYRTLSKADFGRGISQVYEVTFNGSTYYTAAYLRNFTITITASPIWCF